MIALARDVREANVRSDALGLSDDELAFYDALGVNGSAVQVLGDETLRDIAHELVETVRGNVTMDWTLRENVRANLRRFVKRILRKHGYPPDGVCPRRLRCGPRRCSGGALRADRTAEGRAGLVEAKTRAGRPLIAVQRSPPRIRH